MSDHLDALIPAALALPRRPPEVETERLLLRPPCGDDLEALRPILGDPKVAEWLGGSWSRERCAASLVRSALMLAEHGHCLYIAERRDDGRVIGRIGLMRWLIDGVWETEVGYHLGSDAWGQGFATEGARAVRDHAFGALDRERVVSIIVPDNEASQRVARANGMAIDRRFQFHGVFGPAIEADLWAVARP